MFYNDLYCGRKKSFFIKGNMGLCQKSANKFAENIMDDFLGSVEKTRPPTVRTCMSDNRSQETYMANNNNTTFQYNKQKII